MSAKNFFAELKRRKVYRVAAAYAVVSWLLIQIATQVFPFFEIPNWAIRFVVVGLCLGFPIAVILAWIFDITPQGIRRTDEIEPTGPKAAAHAAIPEKSIAVLPFENLSDDKQNEYFAEGVHNDVLANLAKVADLKVISRTSVQQFRAGTRNLREIGAALGVAHVVEGSARRSGNRVRVNAQLIDARSDAHLWAETFDREITDLFALQSELAERITRALRANLSPQEKTSLRSPPTRDVAAYELFLRARELFHWAGSGDSQDNGAHALRLLEEAVARDPQFALAYALESRLHSELFWFGWDKTTSRMDKARVAAEKALRIQPDLGEAHLANAFYYYYGFRRYDLARTHAFAAAHAIPNNSEVPNLFGMIERREGKWDDSIKNLERARELDPRNISVLWNCFETYLALHRYEEAERAADDGLVVSPQAHFFALARSSLALFRNGDVRPHRNALRTIPADFDPGGAVTTVAVRVHLMERDPDAAERALNRCGREKLNDNGLSGVAAALDGYTVPKAWYAGLVARVRGDKAGARLAFERAKKVTEQDLAKSPQDAKTIAMHALLYAALGETEAAVAEANRAVELLPIRADSFDGPFTEITRAVVFTELGQNDRALAELERLLNIPNGPTPGTLRAEPLWDPLRNDPRFRALLDRSV